MSKKKAPDGNGTIRHRSDGRWEGRYTEPNNNGKQVQRSVYGRTQKEVREKLRDILAEINDGTYVVPNQQILGEWLDEWYAEYIVNTTVHTHKSYMGVINNHIKPAIGQYKLSQLDSAIVQKFINGLESTKPNGGSLSPKTVKNIHGVLHSALEQARRLEYISKNPADLTILPRRSKPDICPLSEQKVWEFLQKIKGHVYEWLYIVVLFTGIRQSEALGLTWKAVDFESGTLIIRGQLQYLGNKHGGYVYKETPKNGKTRRIMPTRLVMDSLRQQKKWQEEIALKMGDYWNKEDNLVFTDITGKHLKHDHVYRQFKKIVKEMGIPNARFHDLRHTYAVLSILAGDDVKTVQDNLGHHSAAFTLDTYGHVTDSMKRASARRMDDYISALGGDKDEP